MTPQNGVELEEHKLNLSRPPETGHCGLTRTPKVLGKERDDDGLEPRPAKL